MYELASLRYDLLALSQSAASAHAARPVSAVRRLSGSIDTGADETKAAAETDAGLGGTADDPSAQLLPPPGNSAVGSTGGPQSLSQSLRQPPNSQLYSHSTLLLVLAFFSLVHPASQSATLTSRRGQDHFGALQMI